METSERAERRVGRPPRGVRPARAQTKADPRLRLRVAHQAERRRAARRQRQLGELGPRGSHEELVAVVGGWREEDRDEALLDDDGALAPDPKVGATFGLLGLVAEREDVHEAAHHDLAASSRAREARSDRLFHGTEGHGALELTEEVVGLGAVGWDATSM